MTMTIPPGGGSPERRDFVSPISENETRLAELHREIGMETCELVLSFDFNDPFKEPLEGEVDNRGILMETILRQKEETIVPDGFRRFPEGRMSILIQEGIINRYMASNFNSSEFRDGLNLVRDTLRTLRTRLKEVEPAVTSQVVLGNNIISADEFNRKIREDRRGASLIFWLNDQWESRKYNVWKNEGIRFGTDLYFISLASCSDKHLSELALLHPGR